MASRGLGSLTLDLVLRLGGFSQGADRAERELLRVAEGMKRFKVEGERLAASVVNPFENLSKSIEVYNRLLKEDSITRQTYNRLVEQSTAALAASNTTQQTLSKATLDFNAAMEIATQRWRDGVVGIDVYTKEVEQLKAALDVATRAEQERAKAFEAAKKLAESAITPLDRYLAKLREIAAAKVAAPQLITRQVEQRLTGQARQEFQGADPATVGRMGKLAEATRQYNVLVADARKLTEQFGTTAQQQYRETFKALTRLALAGEITPEIRTAALKEAKALLDSLNPELQRLNALEAETQRIIKSNLGPQEEYNAAIRQLDVLLEETSLGVSQYHKEAARLKSVLDAATISQKEQNKAYADAARLAASAITPGQKYLATLREIASAKIVAPELVTPQVEKSLTSKALTELQAELAAASPAQQRWNQLVADAAVLTARLRTPLQQYRDGLKEIRAMAAIPVALGGIDAETEARAIAELRQEYTALTTALKAADPAQQALNKQIADAQALAQRLQSPLKTYLDRLAEIQALKIAAPQLVTPDIETAAIDEARTAFEKANPAAAEFNRLSAEAARIKAQAIGPQEEYNAAIADAAALLKANEITQQEYNVEEAKQKAILDATNPALKEHARLLEEGARATQAVMTPQERYNAEIARADKLLATYDATLKRTAIDEQTHARLVKQAGDALAQSATAQRKSFFSLRNDILGLNGLLIRFTSIYTAIGAIKGIIDIVDQFKLLENRLSLVTRGTADLKRTQEDLFGVAQRTRQEYAGVIDLYIRLAQAGKELGANQSELIKFTEAVGNALAISGTSAERARGVLIQLSQGLASGTFRAEEFNSVLEGSPQLIRAVASNIDRFHGSVGQLRNAVREGKVTSVEFFDATVRASEELKRQVAGMPLTISQAFTQLKNEFNKAVVSGGDMKPLVDAIQNITKLIKDPAFQRDLATFVNLILKLAGAAISLGATFGRFFEELADNTRAFAQVSGLADLGIVEKDTLAQIKNLEVLQKRYHATLDDIERHPFLFHFDDKEKVLQDIADVEARLAIARKNFGIDRGPQTRARVGQEPLPGTLPTTTDNKDAENAQKSILNLIAQMKQQVAVTGETEEATIRYRIAFGDLVDEFKKAGPAFAKYKDELIKTARALDQFKARKDIEKQTEALRAEVVELQAARIEEEQGAVAALKFRREHNVEMAKTIALARGEVTAIADTVEAVRAIPPMTLKVDTADATAAIKKVADVRLATPTLQVDTSQAEAAIKQVAEIPTPTLEVDTDEATAAIKRVADVPPATLKVDTTQAQAAIRQVADVQLATPKLKVDTADADAAIKKVTDLPTPTLKVDATQATAAVKQITDPWEQMRANLQTPAKVKVDTKDAEQSVDKVKTKFDQFIDHLAQRPDVDVDTEKAENAFDKVRSKFNGVVDGITRSALKGLGISISVKADTAEAEAALDDVKKKTYAFTTAGVKFQPKVDTTAVDVLLRQLEEINKKIATVKIGVDTSALDRQRQEILRKLASLPAAELKLVTDTAPAVADVKAVKEKTAEPVTMRVTADTSAAQKALEDFRKSVKDPAGFPIDLSRPRLPVPGTDDIQTELSITEEIEGRWYNLPQIVKGVMVDVEAAIADARRRIAAGEKLPNFATLEEAVTQAPLRSAAIDAAIKQEAALKAAAAAANGHAAAMGTLTQVTAAYNAVAKENEGLLATAAKAQQSAADTVAAQVKSITDGLTALQAEKIALEEGAVAALNYRIAHGDLQKTFAQVGGAEYLTIIKDLNTQIAAAGGYQKELNEQLDKAQASYAKAQSEAANLADQLRIVTAYQERLTHQQDALAASFQYIPDAEAAAKQYALVVEGLTERLKANKVSQTEFNDAVKRAQRDYEEASKALDELSVFAEQAAKNMQDAFADFLFDPFEKGLDGMVNGVAEMLRRMSAEIIAARLFEKFKVEDFLKSGSLTEGPASGWLKNLFGFGDRSPQLQPIAVGATRMPETTTQTVAELEKVLAVPSTALQSGATALSAGATALQTGATTLQTGATTLQTAAQSLVAASKAMPAAAQRVAREVVDEFPEIVVAKDRLPEGGGAGAGAAAGPGAAGMAAARLPTGASGIVSSDKPWQGLKDIFDDFLTSSATLWGPAAPIIEALQLLQVFNPRAAGGAGAVMNLAGGAGGGVLEEVQITAQKIPESAALTTAATTLSTAATTLTPAATTLTTGATTLTSGATALATGATTFAGASTALTTGASALLTAAQAVTAAAGRLAAAAGSAGSNLLGLFGGGGGGGGDGLSEIVITATRMAQGGKVTGPSGLDKVPLWATAGEFVVKAAAVRQPGVERLLERINRQQSPISGFAGGGRVDAPAQAAVQTVAARAPLAAWRVALEPSDEEQTQQRLSHTLARAFDETFERAKSVKTVEAFDTFRRYGLHDVLSRSRSDFEQSLRSDRTFDTTATVRTALDESLNRSVNRVESDTQTKRTEVERTLFDTLRTRTAVLNSTRRIYTELEESLSRSLAAEPEAPNLVARHRDEQAAQPTLLRRSVEAPSLTAVRAATRTMPRYISPASHAEEEDEQPTWLGQLDTLYARLGLLRLAGGGATDIRLGGPLHGPGTRTSDSLLLLGSTGEFMLQAKAVQQPGARQFLDAFNRGRIRMEHLAGALKDLPHFHSGGPVVNVTAPPAYASGGMVMPSTGTVASQSRQGTTIVQHITVNSPNGQISRPTEMQLTAAAARGARSADRHNN